MTYNLLNLADSYKYSHFNQYPEKIEFTQSYLESRGGKYDNLVFVGLQYILKEYLSKPITQADIDEAEELCKAHGEPFNKAGWLHILNEHDGYLPVRIKALPEGTVVSPKIVMLTVENTDKKVPWLPSWLETLLLKVWYPTTVASKAFAVRETLEKFHMETVGDLTGVPFAFHNFGDRGSSGVESAAIAGMAHLTQFMGTDNFNSLTLVRKNYKQHMAGFSIPATEHSTVTSWGREGEYAMITNYLEKSKGLPIIACVMDSYDVYKATDYVTTVLKDKIESDAYPTFVIRPDSGEPLEVIAGILDIMEKNNVSYTVNAKGYKVFDKYRLIWGDGITPETINAILTYVTVWRKYAATNIAFGSGGDLCQNVNRDTAKFAIKCSSATIDGKEIDVFKDPITDQGKASKKGRQTTVRWKIQGWHDYKSTEIESIRESKFDLELHEELLETVYLNGYIVKEYTFAEVRENAKAKLK